MNSLYRLALFLALSAVFVGCHPEPSKFGAQLSNSQKRQSTSRIGACDLELNKAQELATHGDLKSARDLREYYIDCVQTNYQDDLMKWSESAAKLGDKSDEKEYIQNLTEVRFEGANGREWKAPICADFPLASQEKLAKKDDLAALHALIEYEVECVDNGISPRILTLATKAAKLGTREDAAFLKDLIKIKSSKQNLF